MHYNAGGIFSGSLCEGDPIHLRGPRGDEKTDRLGADGQWRAVH